MPRGSRSARSRDARSREESSCGSCTSFPKPSSAGRSYGHTLACELAKRGHGVRLLANRSNGPLLDRPCPSDLGTFALGRSNRLDPAILRFLVRHLHDFRPHVIHAHNFGPNSWARALGVMHPRLAVVCHVHSGRMVSRHRARRVMLDRVMYRRADAVVALNNEQVTFLEDRLLVPAERIHLMPNGIDMRRFKPPSEDTRNPREVVCVASLTPIKHHEGLLQAWGKVRREIPDAKLTLVGDGELRRKLEEQARSLEIQDSIEFTGIRSDVVPFLERAGVFVLPSLREAMPLALLEAMAAGLASVASDVGGIPEMIEDRFNGRLVPRQGHRRAGRPADRRPARSSARSSSGKRPGRRWSVATASRPRSTRSSASMPSSSRCAPPGRRKPSRSSPRFGIIAPLRACGAISAAPAGRDSTSRSRSGIIGIRGPYSQRDAIPARGCAARAGSAMPVPGCSVDRWSLRTES
ncbi:MAG: glycosyltransferase [Candidatus Eisenbacteria bacterium]